MDNYTGNPANDPTPIQVPDDVADLWQASVINTPTESLADSVAYLRSKHWTASANWPQGIAAWSGAQVGPSGLKLAIPPVWDGAYGRWLCYGFDASGGSGTSAYGLESAGGQNWKAMGGNIGGGGTGSIATVGGLFVRPTDGLVCTIANYNAVGNSTTFVTNAGASAGSGGTLPDAGSGHWWSGGWMATPALFVIWQGGSSSEVPQWSDAAHVFAPATTWSPPGSFVIHDLAHFIGQAGALTVAVIFPGGSSVLGFGMWTIDGKIWSQFAMPTLSLSSEVVIDAAYDAFTGTTYLLTGNSTTSRLWASNVAFLGVSWTLVRTMTVPTYALRANGRELVVWAKLGYSYSSGIVVAYRPIVSVDGGVTWRVCGLTPTTVAPGSYFALRANGSQFLYVNATEYAASLAIPPGAIAAGV